MSHASSVLGSATANATPLACDPPIEFSVAVREQQCRLTRTQLDHVTDLSVSEINAVDEIGQLPRQPHSHDCVGKQTGCP
jgi:hypothetical protein